MRRSLMVFLAPVVFALVSSPALAAELSLPAGKRMAKRGTARPPAVLPAPAASLPQLPAPAYDRSQTTSLTSAVVTTPGATDASSAGGGGEALSPLPASSEAHAPSADTSADRDPSADHAAKAPKGWVLQFGTGALVPATSFISGGNALGPGISFDVRLGLYVTRHVGIVGGFRGSYGHKASGCDEGCSGYSLQAPLLVQLAANDRNHGPYGELGLGFGTTYGASGGGSAVTFSSPVELKLGAGYRLNRPSSSFTADINLGMDVGTMQSGTFSYGSLSGTGSLDAAAHVVVALSLITHFSL